MLRERYIHSHHKNKKRAYFVQNQAIAGYGFFLLSLLISSYLIVLSIPDILGYATDIAKSDLLKFTNQKRADSGLKTLVINETLSKAAESKAKDMFDKDYWAHTSPTGKEPWDFISSAGYDYLYAGENLAVDFSHSKSVVEAWYDSPSHRANLLNDKYSEIGFAVVNGELQGRKTTLVVQMFGSPKKQAPRLADTGSNNTPVPVPEAEVIENTDINKNTLEIPATNEIIEIDNITPEEIFNESEVLINDTGSVLNTTTVFNFSRYLAILLGIFITGMFAIDGYYVRKNGIFRLSGHTFLHVAFLALALVGIWYTTIGLVL
jgi:hypothetical protein